MITIIPVKIELMAITLIKSILILIKNKDINFIMKFIKFTIIIIIILIMEV